jgi:hypothetical protein
VHVAGRTAHSQLQTALVIAGTTETPGHLGVAVAYNIRGFEGSPIYLSTAPIRLLQQTTSATRFEESVWPHHSEHRLGSQPRDLRGDHEFRSSSYWLAQWHSGRRRVAVLLLESNHCTR